MQKWNEVKSEWISRMSDECPTFCSGASCGSRCGEPKPTSPTLQTGAFLPMSLECGMRNAECVASIFSHISILIQLWKGNGKPAAAFGQAPFAVQKWRCPLIGRSRTATGWRGREEGGVSQLNDDPNWSNVSVVSRHSDWSMLISKSGLRDLLRVRTLNQAIGLVKSSMSKCWRLKVQIWSFGFEKFDICFTCFTSLQKPLESSQVS